MRVLFDTNVILDVLLAQAQHVAPATALLDRVAGRTLDGLLGATTVTTIHYLATKAVGSRAAQSHIRTLLGLYEVAPVTRAVLTDALDLALGDYEGAVLHEAGPWARISGSVRDGTSPGAATRSCGSPNAAMPCCADSW